MAKKKQATTSSSEMDDDRPEQNGGELVPPAPPRKGIEIEYNREANGYSVYRTLDGEREDPPIIWHEHELDDCIKRIGIEERKRVIISIELRDD